MTRAFSPAPVDPELLDRLVDLASRSPSAGKTQGWHLVVLEGADTARFWDVALPDGSDGHEDVRSSFRWQRLLDAPVLMIALADPDAYVERYSEADKARTGLGESVDAWTTPYWTVDASMAVMTLLHAAEDVGLGALFFGVFQREAELRAELGIPTTLQIIGAIALGHPFSDAVAVAGIASSDPSGTSGVVPQSDGSGGAGRSARRRRRRPHEIVHRGGW